MKKINNIVILLVAILALAGCKEKMRELNTNPDLISDTQVNYMFTGAVGNWNSIGADGEYGGMHAMMQYIAPYTLGNSVAGTTIFRNPDVDGEVTPNWVTMIYNQVFSGTGNKFQSILNYIETNEKCIDDDGNIVATYLDIYHIVKALYAMTQMQTFMSYGAAVYTEAFKAISTGNTEPNYDLIQDEQVYLGIDTILRDAVNQLKSTMTTGCQTLGTQDFFTGYKSTMKGTRGVTLTSVNNWSEQRVKWMKFFNMTRLENAWLLHDRLGSTFDQIVSECNFNDGFMTSVDDGFYFHSQRGTGNSDATMWVTAYCCMAAPFIDHLVNNQDPRLPLFARPNGCTTETSLSYNMMKDWFPDSLAKYDFLDGKHPYVGMVADPDWKSVDVNDNPSKGFITNYLIGFTKLENPNYPDRFYYTDGTEEKEYCPSGEQYFDAYILLGCEVPYRYFLICGGKRNAWHDYAGNGIRGLGDGEYRTGLQCDGDASADGTAYEDLHLRKREFSYPRQCFLLSQISTQYGKTFGGKSAADWYNAGVRGSFEELLGEAHRTAVQAYTGGDSGYTSYDHTYPSQLTQKTPSGDVTYNYPYSYDDAAVEDYLSKHPYSVDNLYDELYIYGYLDPYVTWMWWRRTGHPQFKQHADRVAAAAEEHIYLEAPKTTDATLGTVTYLTIPRRGCLPDRNTLNDNYLPTKNALIATEGFGDWEETDGQIWWEVPYDIKPSYK